MCYLPGFLAVSLEELLRGGMRRMQAGAGLRMDVCVSVCPGDADGFSHPQPVAQCIPEGQRYEL